MPELPTSVVERVAKAIEAPFLPHGYELKPHLLRSAARNAIAAMPIEALVGALTKARDKFLYYEQVHRLKCTAEGDEKADRNQEMVALCEAALALTSIDRETDHA